MSPPQAVQIVPFLSAGGADRHRAALDRIFYEASSIQSFPDDSARARFRERWLGRYLGQDAAHAFIAVPAPDSDAVGYVVGALDDPATSRRFDDIAYFAALADVTSDYPAHLHINVGSAWRGAGVGGRLIVAFADHARAAGAAGLHIVTGEGMRNVGFYRANGFCQIRRIEVDGKALVMLGLRLR